MTSTQDTGSPRPIVGLIGPNGSGKTTFFRRRSTEPDVAFGQASADIHFFGATPRDHFRVVQRGWQGLDVSEAEKTLGFDPTTPLAKLSVGQRQLVIVGSVVAAGKPVLLLDEPFNGLDAPHRNQVRERLRQAAETAEVWVSSQHSQDLAGLVDAVVVMCDFRAQEPVAMDELRETHPVLSGPAEAVAEVIGNAPVLSDKALGGHRRAVLGSGLSASGRDFAQSRGVDVTYLEASELLDVAVAGALVQKQGEE